MTINSSNPFGPEAVTRLKASIQHQQAEEREEGHKISALLKRIGDDIEAPELDPALLPVFSELELLLQPAIEGLNSTQRSTAVSEHEGTFSFAGLYATEPAPSPNQDDDSGVNAKIRQRRMKKKTLSTLCQARLLSILSLGRKKRLVAISELHSQLDKEEIERLLRIDTETRRMLNSYLGSGRLPDWAKALRNDLKQFFRLLHLASQPNAQAMSIRLDNDTAEAALSAPRGPADYLADIIKRTLKKLGIETEMAFNLEFTHGASKENHSLHIHGVFCIPDEHLLDVTEALRTALALDYRARWNNVAVLLEPPQNACRWASYCLKEFDVTTMMLADQTGERRSPGYSTRLLTQRANAFYEDIGAWFN
jgi:hypothetical protein